MASKPTRINGHFRYKMYYEGRFPLGDQKDLKHDYEFFAGDTIRLEVAVLDECDDPVDITDYDVAFTVKCEEWTADVLYGVDSVADPKHVIKTDPVKGIISILIESTTTRPWRTGQYIFDVELSKDSADPDLEREVYTVLRTWFILKRDVTGFV